jgi:hypothetical protein
MTSLGVTQTFTPEEMRDRLAALTEPFPPQLIEWRVTNTTRDRRGNRGQVVAYADQRAYTDRLNAILSPLGWTREYAVQTVQNFEMPLKGDAKSTAITAKVLLTCKVTVYGLGTHAGTGEEWATDENALTRAEAQAFKRACSCFGLGRYFYDLPRTWVDLDDHNRPLQQPRLPEWAIPKRSNNGRQHNQPRNRKTTPPAAGTSGSGNGNHRQGLYRDELVAEIRGLSEQIGVSLSDEALRRYGGAEELERVRDIAKLTMVIERMEDLARGIARLKRAVETVGSEPFNLLRTEMNLPSDAIDDIPTREVLKRLVERMEALAQRPAAERVGS